MINDADLPTNHRSNAGNKLSKLFGEIRQIAFVVRDIDRAIDYWAKTLGVGPFFIKRQIQFTDYIYKNQSCQSPTVSIALSNSGYIQIELIQQHDDLPSIYKEFLDSRREGLQHVSAWLTRAGFEDKKKELTSHGINIAQECTIPSSGVRLAYFETENFETDGFAKDNFPGGIIFEISDLMEPGQYERIQNIANTAANWDGKQSTIEVTK